MDLNKQFTKGGAEIEFVFEDEGIKETFERVFPKEALDSMLKGDKYDNTDKSTKIYVLVNNMQMIVLLDETKYAEWEKEKDWFHLDIGNPVPLIVATVEFGDSPFRKEDLFDSEINNTIFGKKNPFGPKDEEVKKYLEVPGMEELQGKIQSRSDCRLCLDQTCEGRGDFFNSDALDKLASSLKEN
jgi:hypothetical protein